MCDHALKTASTMSEEVREILLEVTIDQLASRLFICPLQIRAETRFLLCCSSFCRQQKVGGGPVLAYFFLFYLMHHHHQTTFFCCRINRIVKYNFRRFQIVFVAKLWEGWD
jgi:hypothetical protein